MQLEFLFRKVEVLAITMCIIYAFCTKENLSRFFVFMTVFFTEHYPDANTVIASTNREKPPLKSIISKMAILRKRIENVPFPSRSAFQYLELT